MSRMILIERIDQLYKLFFWSLETKEYMKNLGIQD